MYKLIVTKLELLTEEEKRETEMNRRGGMRMQDMPSYYNDIPLGQKPVKTLEVLLTESEYASLKKAVIEVM